MSAYPPVLTPGRELFHNISRLFNSGEVNVDFWGALVNSFIVASAVTVSVVFFSALAGFAFAKLEFRGAQGAAARDRRHDDGPGPARGDPAVHRDDPLRLGRTTCKAVIAPNLVTAFGVFLMRQYIVAVGARTS